MFKRILVGTDGSGTAAAAVAHAVDLAKATGAEVIVTTAYPHPKDAAPPLAAAQGYPGIEIARGLLEDVTKRYGDAVTLRTVAREGGAADAILDLAAEEGVDLIVVGNRGMTGAKRFVLGSVPNAVSHHAPCNVLIVHTTDE
jgi:nucleotide-binding universal stress UspA family protein